ncbi:hypothetical protein HK405_013868, partial [Cladochytrium tenue]
LEERNEMVRRLQEYAQKHSVRITFASGDVHICGFGRFRTEGNAAPAGGLEVLHDHRAMYQVISSGIGNTPPPSMIVKYLHTNPRVLPPKVSGLAATAEEMFETFKTDVDGTELRQPRLLARRNWCSVRALGGGGAVVGAEALRAGALQVTLHVERDSSRDVDAVEYGIVVPALRRMVATGRGAWASLAAPGRSAWCMFKARKGGEIVLDGAWQATADVASGSRAFTEMTKRWSLPGWFRQITPMAIRIIQ